MFELSQRRIGIFCFIVLYPVTKVYLNHLPNPMIEGAILAFNMILPVLCGFLYGPMSGFVAGAVGVGICSLMFGSLYDAASVVPSAVMGYIAGELGKRRSEVLASLSIFVGHSLNLLFFYRLGIVKNTMNELWIVSLGIMSESTMDIAIITLSGFLLKKKFYEANRW